MFSLRELNQTSPLVCFEGWSKFSVLIWSPWEPNLSRKRRWCQLGLLSINFVFRNVIFQPMVFPFVWAKYEWKFMRGRCKLSFPLPLAANCNIRWHSSSSFGQTSLLPTGAYSGTPLIRPLFGHKNPGRNNEVVALTGSSKYSGTPLIRPLLGYKILVVITRWSH